VTDNKTRVPPNSTVRFNFDATAGLVEVFVDGASQGVCFTGLGGMTLYPAIATYLSNRAGRLLRVERNCDFVIGTVALTGGGASAASAPMAGAVAPVFDPARALAANLVFSDGSSVITSSNDTNSMAQTAEGFSRCNAIVEWVVTKDKRDDEGSCIGFSLSADPTCFDYSKAESGLWYRCYNGVSRLPGVCGGGGCGGPCPALCALSLPFAGNLYGPERYISKRAESEPSRAKVHQGAWAGRDGVD